MKDFEVASSLTGRRWISREADERGVLTLSQRLGESEMMSRLLVSRGITFEQAGLFLNPKLRSFLPDPDHLKDMVLGVKRLVHALKNKEKITIFGDYDVDGATSSALLYRFLRAVGAEVNFYIPDRLKEGYGPNANALVGLKKEGTQVVITVDCGTTAFEALEVAEKAELEVIIIDHHVAEPKLPRAVAIINPNRLDETSPLKNLAAVGLCFLTMVSLNRALRQEGWYQTRAEPDLFSLLDLVALGTVCDVVPLQDLNRAFVTQGLKVMAQRQNLGLTLLADHAGLKEAPSPYHLGFILGPRINAGGRVGKSTLGVRLLTTEDPLEAKQIAEELSIYNAQRQDIENQVYEEALFQADAQKEGIIVAAGKDWHPGVIGIVAGRLKERFHRPALVISFDEEEMGSGSGRSIPGVDLGTLIHAARQKGLLIKGGGHAMAAGFGLRRDQLADFHAFLNEKLFSLNLDLTPYVRFDGVLSSRAVNSQFIRDLERLGPFGQANPSPKFVIADVWIGWAGVVGQNHVRCTLNHMDGSRLDGIAFRCVESPLGEALLNPQGKWFHLLGSLKEDAWNGRTKIQFLIEDMAVAHETRSLAKGA